MISFHPLGNPLSYRGATMSWFGRQMRTYSKDGITANFMYDADGLRSAKAVNGVKTTYQYVGDQLFYEKIGENKTLYYFYDSYGNLSQIYYTFGTGDDASTARYFVSTNAQGDVIGLYNSNGVKVGAYDYDAWGNTRMFVVTQDANGNNVHTQIDPETQYLNHIVNVNPIRYRGYYYDSDLDLYYLQSRYYDAEIGRFINSDNVSDSDSGVLGYNTFIYCGNNPVNYSDATGHGKVWNWIKKVLGIGQKNSMSTKTPQYKVGDYRNVEYTKGTFKSIEYSNSSNKPVNVYSCSNISGDDINNGISISSESYSADWCTSTNGGWNLSLSAKTDVLSGCLEIDNSYDYMNITVSEYTSIESCFPSVELIAGEYHNLQIDSDITRMAGAAVLVSVTTYAVSPAIPAVFALLVKLATDVSSGGLVTAR